MNLGGPVWHASAAGVGGQTFSEQILSKFALKDLEGVGDPDRGEWRKWTGFAFHVRRRLTADEALVIGPVVDVRGTNDGLRRCERMRRWLPDDAREI